MNQINSRKPKCIINATDIMYSYYQGGDTIKIFKNVNKQKFKNQTILFSPCAASFDNFKNFEDRGLYFNKLIKRQLNGI